MGSGPGTSRAQGGRVAHKSALFLALLVTACGPGSIDDGDAGVAVDPGEPPPIPERTDQDNTIPDRPPPPPATPPSDATPPEHEEAPPLPPDPPPPEAIAVLDVHAMDLWAQYFWQGAELEVDVDGVAYDTAVPLARIPLFDASLVHVKLSAPEHEPLEVTLGFTGDGSLDAVLLEDDNGAAGRAGFSLSHDMEGALPVHSLFLGLRHKWFAASGRPARRGNFVALYMDGEEAWSHVAPVLRAATKTVELATWFFESDFELERPAGAHLGMSAAQRRANTMMSILEGVAASKRVLVGQFWRQDGSLSDLSSDDAIRAKGAAAGDDFEYMGQANETFGMFTFAVEPFGFADRVKQKWPAAASRHFDDDLEQILSTTGTRTVDLTDWPAAALDVQHASFHQKFAVVDEDIAFVGGMNVKATDWDTSQHLVFEPRRFPIEASNATRAQVLAKEEDPDTGPRKDYMVGLWGPAAHDVRDVFKKRWDQAKYDQVAYHQNASSFTVGAPQWNYGNVQAQITTTLPDPYWEHSIIESWYNAVAQAETYVYIEDQYFRAPMLNDQIKARMRARPNLKLVVVTKIVNEWTDPGCEWTAKSYHDLVGEFGVSRVKFLKLVAFDTQVTWGIDETDARFVDMDVHSKVLLVDDKFISVGSANKNNRGMMYEGEMNVAVVDATWVRAARRRIIENLAPGLNLQYVDNFDVWWTKLGEVAAWNDWVRAKWAYEGDDLNLDGAALPSQYKPLGFVYGLSFRSADDCLIEGVGADMM
jgi:phosphatidylserine/phosphatidylglycerophosphate/cardiolipin synthase-like enzyme